MAATITAQDLDNMIAEAEQVAADYRDASAMGLTAEHQARLLARYEELVELIGFDPVPA